MNREEIERNIEEALKEQRAKKSSLDINKIRSILNFVFIACAIIGLIMYFAFPEQRLTGMAIIGVGMLLKIAEFFLRFLF